MMEHSLRKYLYADTFLRLLAVTILFNQTSYVMKSLSSCMYDFLTHLIIIFEYNTNEMNLGFLFLPVNIPM